MKRTSHYTIGRYLFFFFFFFLDTKPLMTIDRYEAGIEKLQSAAVVVAESQEQLKQLQPALIATSKETSELIATVEQQRVELDSRQKV
jgi:hypothetical protein